jgi:hypothetical protein
MTIERFGNKLKNFGKYVKQFFKEFYVDLTCESPYGIVCTLDRINTIYTKQDRMVLDGIDLYKIKEKKGD